MPLTLLVGSDIRPARVDVAPRRTRRTRQRRLWRVDTAAHGRGLRIAQRRAVLAASVRSSTAATVRAQVSEEVETLRAEVARLRGARDAVREDAAALRTRLQHLEEALRLARSEHADAVSRLEELRTVEFDLRRSLIAVGVSAEQQTHAMQQELEQSRAMNQALMQVLERQIADVPRLATTALAVPREAPAVEASPRPWYRRLWPWGVSASPAAPRG